MRDNEPKVSPEFTAGMDAEVVHQLLRSTNYVVRDNEGNYFKVDWDGDPGGQIKLLPSDVDGNRHEGYVGPEPLYVREFVRLWELQYFPRYG